MNLIGIILSEINQTKKEYILYDSIYMKFKQAKLISSDRSQNNDYFARLLTGRDQRGYFCNSGTGSMLILYINLSGVYRDVFI